jgi:uridine kinase
MSDGSNLAMKPQVVGIYGISGCGKTTLITQLKECISSDQFEFYDRSQVLYEAVEGG